MKSTPQTAFLVSVVQLVARAFSTKPFILPVKRMSLYLELLGIRKSDDALVLYQHHFTRRKGFQQLGLNSNLCPRNEAAYTGVFSLCSLYIFQSRVGWILHVVRIIRTKKDSEFFSAPKVEGDRLISFFFHCFLHCVRCFVLIICPYQVYVISA